MEYTLDFYKQNNIVKIVKENLFVDLYVKPTKTLSTKRKYEVICFNNKKKILYHEILENNQIYLEANKIMNSYMAVIRTNAFFKVNVINMLRKICTDCKCFALIVFSEDNDIIFFPKLRYYDGYLIKSILENVMQDKQYKVVCGSEDMVVI